MVNFGWEYVWHCHILSHEENDMMRPIIFRVGPEPPSNLTAVEGGTGVDLAWSDNADDETGFTLERADDPLFTTNLVSFDLPADTVAYTDATAVPLTPYYFRVRAYNAIGVSAWSNTAFTVPAPITVVSPPALAFGPIEAFTSSLPQSVTLSNIGNAPLVITGIAIAGASPSNFAQTNTCGANLAVGVSCNIIVTFNPTATVTGAAVLVITSNDPVSPSLTVPLSGTVAVAQTAFEYDFNGDGKSDILWRYATTGQNYLWLMDGKAITDSGYLLTVPLNWRLASTGDFNGDGKSDILWRHATTGQNYLWLMDGKTVIDVGYLLTVADLNWQLAGTGDFNGDGKSDILWRHATTGQNYLWLMNGKTIIDSGYLLTVSVVTWRLAGTGDFNGDGKSDILWRHATTGQNYLWQMDGATVIDVGYLLTVADLNWRLASTGDFNGDGKSDILWRHATTGQNYLWLMNGKTIIDSGYLLTVPLNWRLASTGDFNGDGKSDILWRNATTGQNYLWQMDGATVIDVGYLLTVSDLNWQVQ